MIPTLERLEEAACKGAAELARLLPYSAELYTSNSGAPPNVLSVGMATSSTLI